MDSTHRGQSVMNRRVLFIVAVLFGLGIVLGRYCHLQTIYIITAAALLVLAVIFMRRKVFFLVCIAAAFFGAFLSASVYDVNYIETGEDMQISGRVYSEPYQNDYDSTVYLLDQTTIDGQPAGNVKLYLPRDTPPFTCGDVIRTTAQVNIPKGVRNPGGFDDKLYLLTQGVHYKAYADEAELAGTRGGLSILFAQARQSLKGTVNAIFEPDVAPIAAAMLLGDKQSLPDETYTAFKDTGMAHVLAVSGLHAGILIGFIYYGLLAWLRVGRKPRLIITLVFVVLYACVAGLTPSILRASIMACALLIGTYTGRQTDTLNFFALALIATLLINPLDLFTASFQLSFGAVFGMLTLGWQVRYWLSKRLPGYAVRFGDAVAMSAGATVGTMPILAATFNRISTFSIITNIFIIPFASFAIICVFIATLFGLLLGTLATPIAAVASVIIRIIMRVIDWLGNLSFVALDVPSPPWYLIAAVFALLLISSKYLLIRTKIKTIAAIGISVALIMTTFFIQPHGMYMVFLDVGQADAAFIKTAQGGEYFVDGGRAQSADEVVDFTIRNGYTPEAAFVTHTDADHFSGIVALYQAGLLGKVYCSWQEQDVVKAAMPNANVVPLSAGDTVLLDDNTQALILYPYKDTKTQKANESSLVLLVQYNGHTALLTGDISGEIETRIFANVSDVDIYKAAHHGSKYSSYRLPLQWLSPQYSVVSVGANAFGHPHQLAMRNLADYSGQVYTTMDDYAVAFYINERIYINTFGENE